MGEQMNRQKVPRCEEMHTCADVHMFAGYWGKSERMEGV